MFGKNKRRTFGKSICGLFVFFQFQFLELFCRKKNYFFLKKHLTSRFIYGIILSGRRRPVTQSNTPICDFSVDSELPPRTHIFPENGPRDRTPTPYGFPSWIMSRVRRFYLTLVFFLVILDIRKHLTFIKKYDIIYKKGYFTDRKPTGTSTFVKFSAIFRPCIKKKLDFYINLWYNIYIR